jgi:hypothetical protein
MPKLNTTTSGIITATLTADSSPALELQQNGVAIASYGNIPAFSAYLSTNQNPSNATYTKVQINTESFDTANCFDTSLYRFTPNVSGYYQVQAACRISSTTPSTYVWAIYKNGSNIAELNIANTPANFDNRVVSSLVSMNGTTDYLEFYCYCAASSGQTFNAGSNATYFQAFLVKAA